MADATSPQRMANYAAYQGGGAVPIVIGSTTRVNATAGATSTAAAAVPSGGRVLIVRAVDNIWIRFGTSSVGAAAADANSILFTAGEGYYVMQPTDTHFRVLRVGASDVLVQLESAGTL